VRQGLTPTASGSLGAGIEEAIGRMASAAPLRRGEPVALDEYLVRRGPAPVHTWGVRPGMRRQSAS